MSRNAAPSRVPPFGRILLAAALTCAASPAAPETLPGPYPAAVERVVDGDTVRVRVAIWLGQELTVLVRIRGIDAPEVRGRCAGETALAQHATDALERLVAEKPVTLMRIEGDKYFGRVVADVQTASGKDIGGALIAGGHARAYDGGKRRSWCEVRARPVPPFVAIGGDERETRRAGIRQGGNAGD